MSDLIKSINNCKSLEDLNKIKIDIFGKKGRLAFEFLKLKDIDESKKKIFAEELNKKKVALIKAFNDRTLAINEENMENNLKLEEIDLSLYSNLNQSGAIHPITKVTNRVIQYFLGLNFSLEDGPKIENEFFNFEALNLPKEHPARDMQDSFFVKMEKF